MKCDKCKSEPVIYLAYADAHLCKSHFFGMFEKRFRATIRQFGLIRKAERVVVGLSGGKDSTVLMHLLAGLRKSLPFELIALTVDEGIEGYRASTIAVARREAKKLGLRHVILSFKKESGKSLDQMLAGNKKALPCSYCGVVRRHLLNKGARKLGAGRIAIGHNLDDVAQTVLMNMMRNEPLRLVRFGGPLVDDEAFIPRIRPLMRAPEREIAIYAMLKGIKIGFRECPYAHGAFRLEVRHHLNELEEKHPGTKQRIFNSFMEMQKLMRKGLGNQKFGINYCKICGEPASNDECMYCRMLNPVRER